MRVDQGKNKIDLSIITIAYKINSDLFRCIHSCNFSEINTEHILVFPDREKEKVLSEFNNDFHLIFDSGKGVYNAVNEGLRITKGKKVLVLHGDNYLTNEGPNLIEKHIDNQNIQFGCNSILNNKRKKTFLFTKINFLNLICGLYPPHPGLVLDNSNILKIGLYNEKYKICSDFDYYIRIFQSKIKIVFIKEQIIESPIGGISSSGLKSVLFIILERFQILKNFYWFLTPLLPITILMGYIVKLIHRNY